MPLHAQQMAKSMLQVEMLLWVIEDIYKTSCKNTGDLQKHPCFHNTTINTYIYNCKHYLISILVHTCSK